MGEVGILTASAADNSPYDVEKLGDNVKEKKDKSKAKEDEGEEIVEDDSGDSDEEIVEE